MVIDGRCHSLEGKSAAVELLGSAKASFLGWGAAEQQELVGRVHKLQLLYNITREPDRETTKESEIGEVKLYSNSYMI